MYTSIMSTHTSPLPTKFLMAGRLSSSLGDTVFLKPSPIYARLIQTAMFGAVLFDYFCWW